MSSNSAIPPSVQSSQSPNPPPSSAAPPPSSAAPPPPSSNTPAPPPSSNPPASSPPRSTPAPPPASTQIITGPSAAPTATEIQTSFILVTASPTRPGESVVVITSVLTAPPGSRPTNGDATGAPRSTSTNPTEFQPAKNETSGLSPGGKTAIAVVIPVIVVALLAFGALFFWRKRKQRKSNEDERRKEVEEYGFNPNHDPTLPAVGMAMAEDESGYRGWGNTNTSSKGKSTTLTSGMTYSDSNSNPGGYANPGSPTHGTYSEANSNDPLVNRRETLDSDGIGALGATGGAAAYSAHNAGVRRGPSNASSSYSAAGQSDNSGEYPGMPNNGQHDYYNNDAQGYYQSNPYENHGPYASSQPQSQQQPVIRDVTARRNTRIENPSVFPQQGNSGISQNF